MAAYELYGGPCITIDFGTATSFGVISKRGEFLGGAICPGIKLAADALTDRTAKLPRFELQSPESVIGKNTVANMQSGIVYGYIGQVSYLVERMKREDRRTKRQGNRHRRPGAARRRGLQRHRRLGRTSHPERTVPHLWKKRRINAPAAM